MHANPFPGRQVPAEQQEKMVAKRLAQHSMPAGVSGHISNSDSSLSGHFGEDLAGEVCPGCT